MKKLLKKPIGNEKGQALAIVLILMALGGIILAPLLSYTSSGLKVGKTYEKLADEFYAADAGVEDGLWHINYNQLDDIFSNYHRYDFNTVYEYPLLYPLEVNDIDVTVKINNVWIPKDITAPAYGDAEQLIGEGKLIIAGSVSAMTEELKEYEINVYYYKEPTDGDLFVNKIGIWLPPGFSYDEDGECTLETWLDENSEDYTRQITAHRGGQAIVWTFTNPILYTELPGVNELETPMMYTFTFLFEPDDPESERSPEAVSWITTSGVPDVPFTWDADVKVYHINSQANETTINAYAIKSELRQLVSGRSGDYRAIGNTLMLDLVPDTGGPVRDYLLGESSATVDDIPDNAQVEAAYLYWSAWITGDEYETLFIDHCQDIWEQWAPGNDWSSTQIPWYDWVFQAHHSSGGEPELEMKEPLELSTYAPGTVIVSFKYWKSYGQLGSDDCLDYAFYNDEGWSNWYNVFCDDVWPGGVTWYPQTFTATVPDAYLTAGFKMKFRISGFDDPGKYCYIDDIEVAVEVETVADTEVNFTIGDTPVHLEKDEYDRYTVPVEGPGSIPAFEKEVLPTDPGYSYCCRADVTPLIREFTENGNETYTVGGAYGDIDSQWSYDGWSLIIMFSSPETQRQQLYLYDLTRNAFSYIKPHTTGVSFSISGFLVPDPILGETIAAKITCFVGDGDDFYSGDFIALNAPPELEGPDIPNSYKLWDRVNLPPPAHSPWMPNNEDSPNNVWNSRSEESGGTEIDGVDIDTFYVPWGDPPSEGLLKPDDSAATISLNFAGESALDAELINFIYIIISFRSDVVIGGTVSYLVD